LFTTSTARISGEQIYERMLKVDIAVQKTNYIVAA